MHRLTIPSFVLLALHVCALRRVSPALNNTFDDKQALCLIGQFCEKQEIGLAVTLVTTVVQALSCESHGAMPYVYWKGIDRPNYCKKTPEQNCWTSYFKPGPGSADVHGRSGSFCHKHDNAFFVHNYNPNVIRENLVLRKRIQNIFERHLQLQPSLQAEVDNFKQHYFDNHIVIGIHVRDGDGSEEYAQAALPIKTYIDEAERIAKRLGSDNQRPVRFYVASNGNRAFKEFQKHFGTDQILSSNALHVDDSRASGVECGNHDLDCPVRNAEGVLMDIWLLSQSDHFIYWQTSLAWAVLLKNKNLEASRVGPPPDQIESYDLNIPNHQDIAKHIEYMKLSVDDMNEEFKNQIDTTPTETISVQNCLDCKNILNQIGAFEN